MTFVFHLPRDYEDRSTIIPMNQLVVGRSYLEGVKSGLLIFHLAKRSHWQHCYRMILARSLYVLSYLQGSDRPYQDWTTPADFGEVRVGARHGLELYHPEIQVIQQHTAFTQNPAYRNLPKYRGPDPAQTTGICKQALQYHSDELAELLP